MLLLGTHSWESLFGQKSKKAALMLSALYYVNSRLAPWDSGIPLICFIWGSGTLAILHTCLMPCLLQIHISPAASGKGTGISPTDDPRYWCRISWGSTGAADEVEIEKLWTAKGSDGPRKKLQKLDSHQFYEVIYVSFKPLIEELILIFELEFLSMQWPQYDAHILQGL